MEEMTEREIDEVLTLCRIALTPAERAHLKKDLQRIISYFAMLDELPLDESPFDLIDQSRGVPLRKDLVSDLYPREEFLANAPDVIAGVIRVPLMIDKQEGEAP